MEKKKKGQTVHYNFYDNTNESAAYVSGINWTDNWEPRNNFIS